MLKVEVWYHKDGDHLVVAKIPWWTNAYEFLVNRICPCCGISGWISGKSETVEVFFYRIWNWLLKPTYDRWHKELYRVPIENGCVASRALWPEREPSTCFRDDCENCWDWKDDAYQYKAPEPIRSVGSAL